MSSLTDQSVCCSGCHRDLWRAWSHFGPGVLDRDTKFWAHTNRTQSNFLQSVPNEQRVLYPASASTDEQKPSASFLFSFQFELLFVRFLMSKRVCTNRFVSTNYGWDSPFIVSFHLSSVIKLFIQSSSRQSARSGPRLRSVSSDAGKELLWGK